MARNDTATFRDLPEYLQQDQPPGVPPLALTGERTLPDLPEENYWFRRHLVVYEWLARRCRGLAGGRPGLRRGLRLRRAGARAPPRWSGSTPTRRRSSTPGCATGGPTCASSGCWSSSSASACDAIVFLQTIEHVERPEELLSRFAGLAPVSYVSTPNRLTLAPPGAEKSENPWHLREYTIAEYRELLEPHFSRVEVLGLFHARKLRAHELAIRLGWDRVHRALRITKPFYDRFTPAIDASDFALRPGGSRPGPGLPRRLPGPDLPLRDTVGDLAIVLHSHMPYVEGFGTYPFGEEWLFDAVIRSYLPVLEVARDLTMTVTPVLADQLEDAGVDGAAAGVPRPPTGSAAPRPTFGDLDPECRPAARERAGPLPARAGAAGPGRGGRARPLQGGAGVGPGRAGGLGRDPRRAAADRDPGRDRAADRDRACARTGGASAGRGASGCPNAPTSPGLEWRLAEHGVRWFCLNQSAHEPGTAALAPAATEAGPVAFTIDWEAVQWLWSLGGYPSERAVRPVRRALDAGHEDLEGRRRAVRPGGGGGRRRGRQAAEFCAAAAARLGGFREVGRQPRPARLRGRHRADRPLVVGGADLAGRGAAGGAGARLAIAHPLAGARRARARGPAASRLELGGGRRPAHLGLGPRRGPGLGSAAQRAEAATGDRGGARPRCGDTARPASCSRCSRATGPSSTGGARPASTPSCGPSITPGRCSRP